jgi:hypothetical protein
VTFASGIQATGDGGPVAGAGICSLVPSGDDAAAAAGSLSGRIGVGVRAGDQRRVERAPDLLQVVQKKRDSCRFGRGRGFPACGRSLRDP